MKSKTHNTIDIIPLTGAHDNRACTPANREYINQWQIATDSNGIYGLMSWPLDNFASIARFCFSDPLYLSE
jgi:hypothetical protein